MIFKDTSELRQYVNVSEGLTFEVIQPDIERTELTTLKKFLGDNQYTELVMEYQLRNGVVDDMEGRLKLLLIACRPAVALLAFYNASGLLSVQISDSGFQMLSSDTHKQAFAWMKNDARIYLSQFGYVGIDMLLKFLEANKEDYPFWTADTKAYTINKKYLINSADEFQEEYNIGESRLTFLALQPIMKRVEMFQVSSQISPALFTEIKTQIAANELSEDNAILMQWIKPASALYTIARGMTELPLEVNEGGVMLNFYKAFQNDASKEKNPAPTVDLEKHKQKLLTDGDAYLNLCLSYLRENATAERYAAFFNSTLFNKGVNTPFNNKPEDKMIGMF